MKVARHEMPGKWPKMIRPVLSAIARIATEEGNGVIRGARFYSPSKINPDTLADRSYRTLRDGFLDAAFPGISCLDFGELSRVATITWSLRDSTLACLC
jgi:hypothetical protein